MSDEDDKASPSALARPEEEALRLKTLAEHKYASGNLKSALKHAKRALKLHPSLDGLPEMITAFKILRTAASAAASPDSETASANRNSPPDYYQILQVERFSHLNTIKKQYKKLALSLHPDKNPFPASAEAFKLVGEAARVLSDKIRRKEYDTKLRVAMQSKEAEGVGFEAETFWTACSTCRLLHQFERRYLGHNLVCPSCKKSFKAMEVEEGTDNSGVDVEKSQVRVSARIREKVAKGGSLGIVEKCGLGVKRKMSSVEDILERSEMKTAKDMSDDGVLLKDLKLEGGKKVEKSRERDDGDKLVNGGSSEGSELRTRRVVGKVRNGVGKESSDGEVEIAGSGRAKRAKVREEDTMTLSQMQGLVKKDIDMAESDRAKRAKAREEDTMTLSHMQNLVKKKIKQGERKSMIKEKDVNGVKLKEKENERDEEEEMVNESLKAYRRRVSKDKNVKIVNKTSKSPLHLEIDMGSSRNDNLEGLLVETEKENGGGNEKANETEYKREKRERRRVSKYADCELVERKSSKNQRDLEIERLFAKKKDSLEIMPVEDSDFHDFDKDRKERSFKKGQVWAVYDDDDGMPRHYVLIDQIVSINPFEVTLSWLQFQSNQDDELISRQKMGFHVSCGSFKVSRKVSITYLNLFSHDVKCERAARELYRIYPTKGSIWALYKNNTLSAEERNQNGVKDNRCYDIVISLSSFSDLHGLSIAHLEKVPGFRTVFKRKEIGANAVICLGKNDVFKLFSHQIPAKKLSGDEASGLPKDCWELDPASLTPQLLIGT